MKELYSFVKVSSVSLSRLTNLLSDKCGGSDAFSGITAMHFAAD
ncbi:MAG: hypothetical protein ACLUP7_02225 [Eubacterium sp.]